MTITRARRRRGLTLSICFTLLAAGCAYPRDTSSPTVAARQDEPAAADYGVGKIGAANQPAKVDNNTRASANPPSEARPNAEAATPPPAAPMVPAAAPAPAARMARGTAQALPYAPTAKAQAYAPAVRGHANEIAGMSAPGFAPMPVFSGPPLIADNRERYQHLDDNPLHLVADDPVSTFSLDVDTGSYSNVRRFLNGGQRPPEDAVRVEELVNYFPYDYPRSQGENPFGIRTELAPCPWKPEHWLLRVAVRADEVDAKTMPAANLVFLVDVSGSMDDPAKLPLLRSSLKLLVDQLRSQDRVSLAVYAGREAVVLEPTAGDQHGRIARAIDELAAGGSTAGEAGIRLAYRMAREGFIKGGINRVMLATDGDFNVGTTDFEQLKDLVEHERESGVQLSTLGFGAGNYNEAMMEQLADAGNGSYAYIDTLTEGRKVLVDQMRSTLVTVAKDVKVQIEFNAATLSEYRLIGYENRILAREDFNNDKIDAGDVGAGQSVTALYELTPAGAAASVDPLRYGSGHQTAPTTDDAHEGPSRAQHAGQATQAAPASTREVAFVKLRYKKPNATVSRLMEVAVERSALLASFDDAGDDFRFATAVAGFGQLLRGGKRTGAWTWDDVLGIATAARGKDEFGYRSEFLSLVRMAKISG